LLPISRRVSAPDSPSQRLCSRLVETAREPVRPDEAARRLLESRGYRQARRHYEMTIELVEQPPDPELPEGLSIETLREPDARAWHAAATEALKDLWGFEATPFEDWWRLRAGDDHSLWFLVRDGGEIAAFARCEADRRGGGLVGEIGVRKPWRQQGLGRARRCFEARSTGSSPRATDGSINACDTRWRDYGPWGGLQLRGQTRVQTVGHQPQRSRADVDVSPREQPGGVPRARRRMPPHRRGRGRPLKAWGFFHCPSGTAHVIVGTGDRPAVVLAVGACGGRKAIA
jgi:hypothetical protein